ncbi:MAG: TolC family protein, partial [Bacteroidota bacterium]
FIGGFFMKNKMLESFSYFKLVWPRSFFYSLKKNKYSFMMHLATYSLLCMLMGFTSSVMGQKSVRIGLVHDLQREGGLDGELQEAIKVEITSVLKSNYIVEFREYDGGLEAEVIRKNIEQAYLENDLVITTDLIGSQIMSSQQAFQKPSIAGLIMDGSSTNLKGKKSGTSGIDNFTFVESPFNIQRDLQTLYQVRPYKNLAVVYEQNYYKSRGDYIIDFISENLPDSSVSLTAYDFESWLNGESQFSTETDAVYVLPIFSSTEDEIRSFFDKLSAEKLPSSTFLGEEYIQKGALIAHENTKNLSLLTRRIALNSLNMLDGMNASDLPVSIQTFNEKILFNMETARRINIFPDFDFLAKTSLVNIEEKNESRKISLQSVIAEALRQNLDLQVSQMDVNIAEKNVGIAKSDQLPQLDISSSFSTSDETTALIAQGFQGQTNWIGSAKLSQVIFSEPMLANIAVQKLLKKGADYDLQQSQLDIIVDVAEAYLNILQAEANLSIQQKNVEVTKENLDISNAKKSIGYVGTSDFYRWEAELATKNIDLTAALATVQQAKYRLNQLLNRPIDEPFSTTKETF